MRYIDLSVRLTLIAPLGCSLRCGVRSLAKYSWKPYLFFTSFGVILERTEDLVQLSQGGNRRFNPLEGYFQPWPRESRKRGNQPGRRWTSRVEMLGSGLDSSRHG
jgi:hypothetical protein